MSDLQSAYHFVYQKVLELWVNSGGSDWSGVMSLWLPFLTQVPWNTPLFKCLRARAGLKLLSKSRGSYVSLKCWIGSKTMLSGHHCPQIGYLWFHTGSHATQPVAHIIDPRMHRRDEALYVGFPWKFSRFLQFQGGDEFRQCLQFSTENEEFHFHTSFSGRAHYLWNTSLRPTKRNNIVLWCLGKNIVGID